MSRDTEASITWPFDDPPNVATITVRQIVEGVEPILLVSRDAEERDWQFLTGGVFSMADAKIVSLRSMFERVGGPWRRSESPEE